MRTKVTVYLKHVADPVVFITNSDRNEMRDRFQSQMSIGGNAFSIGHVKGYSVFRSDDIAAIDVEPSR